MDPGGRRRGWHDHVAHSAVVDVRPVPVEEPEVDVRPRHVVNLTAMRLVPAPQAAPVAAPPVAAAPASAAPPAAAASPPPAPPTAPPAAPAVAPAAARRHRPAGRRRARQPGTRRRRAADRRPAPGVAAPAARATRVGSRTRPPRGPPSRGPRPATARWRVSFDSGESFVVEGLALVGRRPEPRDGEPVRHLVPLRSTDMSLSKTHAQFQVSAGGQPRRRGPRLHQRVDPDARGRRPASYRGPGVDPARGRPRPFR